MTINHPHAQIEEEDLKELKYQYFISGYEEGEETHTPHLQCYMMLKKRTRPSALRKIFGNAHFELARGTPLENFTYCSKDGDWIDFGELPTAAQGARSDAIAIRDGIIAGKSDHDLIMDDSTLLPWLRNYKGIGRMRQILNPPIDRPETKVSLIYGRPGTGKSSFAKACFPKAYWKDDTQWWDFYEGEDTVVWDEFGGWCCTPTQFNRIFDKYKHNIQVKGDVVALRATNFVIVTNFLPSEWWDVSKVKYDIMSITRRIDIVYWFQALNEEALVFTSYEEFDKALR